MHSLSEAEFERAERIAWFAARHERWASQNLTVTSRHDVALTAILDDLAEYGWPDDTDDLFRAARNAIRRGDRAHGKDLRHADYWLPPKTTADDPLGESVVERIAIWQVVWAMTDKEWSAVWALGEAYRRGQGPREAAGILGINYPTLMSRLEAARARARALWVAPGDHPASHYMPGKNGQRTRLQRWHEVTRRERRQAELEEAS